MRAIVFVDEVSCDIEARRCVDDRNPVRIDQQRDAFCLRVCRERIADVILKWIENCQRFLLITHLRVFSFAFDLHVETLGFVVLLRCNPRVLDGLFLLQIGAHGG